MDRDVIDMDMDRLNRIEDKLDKMLEVQVEMQKDVAHHIYRTELAEANIEKIANEIKPIQEHVAFLRVSGKLLAGVVAILAAVASIIQLLGGK